jgi:hypothetical protein
MSLVLNVEILGEFRNLTAATKGAQTQLSSLSATTKKISTSISRSLATIGVGFSLYWVIDQTKQAVTAASDLEQQFGALDSVFKDQSGNMKAFAQNANKMGLSTADAARNMALLGSLLKGSGMEMVDVSKNTKTLTGLAADMAATFGGTAADAVSALGSAFKGEFDPLERFGVSIKKSDVNARMAAEGYTAAAIQTDKLAYSQTLMTMILEKTTDAQGQANRESETYAGKLARLTASFKDLQAAIGEELLPILVDLSSWFLTLIPQVKTFIGELTNPVTPMGKAWAALGTSFVNFGKTLNAVFAGGKADANGFITVLKILKSTLDAVTAAIKIVSGQYASEAGFAAGSAIRDLFTPSTPAPTVTKAPVLNTKIPTVNSSSPVKAAPKVTVNVTQAVTAKTIIDTVAAYQKSTGTTLAQALR